eukprot:scaffold1066_cov115-Isochrysis_galbana.AAC.4
MARRSGVRRRLRQTWRRREGGPYPRRTLEQILISYITKAIGSPLGPRGMLVNPTNYRYSKTKAHPSSIVRSPIEGKSRLMRT